MISNAWTCRPGPQGGCSAFGSPTHIHTHKIGSPQTPAADCCRVLSAQLFFSFFLLCERNSRPPWAWHSPTLPKKRKSLANQTRPSACFSVVGLRRRILQNISFIYISKRPSQPARGHGSIIIYILLHTTFISNYNSFDFFDAKFDHLSYSKKNCANIVKFKSFLKNFC